MKRDLCFTGELVSDLMSSFVSFGLSVVCNADDDDDDGNNDDDEDEDEDNGTGC
jgi:hypothetical protein